MRAEEGRPLAAVGPAKRLLDNPGDSSDGFLGGSWSRDVSHSSSSGKTAKAMSPKATSDPLSTKISSCKVHNKNDGVFYLINQYQAPGTNIVQGIIRENILSG